MEADAVLASSEWVSAGGIALVLIGLAFFILEIFLPSFGLFGFAGAAAVLIGVIQLHQTGYIEDLPISIEAIIALALLFLLLSIIGGVIAFKMFKKQMTTGIEGMVGDTARIIDWDGTTGHVFVQGENWQAYSDEPNKLKKNDQVFVSKVEKLKVKIIPKSPTNTAW